MKNTVLIIGDPRFDTQHTVEYKRGDMVHDIPVSTTTATARQMGGVGRIAEIVQSANYNVRLLTIVGDDSPSQAYDELVRGVAPVTYIESQHHNVLMARTYVNSGGTLLMCSNNANQACVANRDTSLLLTAMYQLSTEQLSDIGVVVLFDCGAGVCSAAVCKAITDFSNLYAVAVVFATSRSLVVPGFATLITSEDAAEEATVAAIHPCLASGVAADIRRDTVTKLVSNMAAGADMYVCCNNGDICYTVAADGGHVQSLTPAIDMYKTNHVDSRIEDAAAIAAITHMEQSNNRPIDIRNYIDQAAAVEVGSYLPYDRFKQQQYQAGAWPAKLQSADSVMRYVDRIRRLNENHRIALVIGLFDGIDHTDIEFLRLVKQRSDHVIVAYRRHEMTSPATTVPDSFRATHLAMLPCTDFVCGFNGDYERLVRQVRPDVLADADSAPGMPVPGDDFMAARGGVVLHKPVSPYYG